MAISGFDVRNGGVDTTVPFISVSLDDPQVVTDDTEPRIVAVDHDTTMGSYDAGYCAEDDRYAAISIRGVLDDNLNQTPRYFPNRTFVAVDQSSQGRVFACDDTSGDLCLIEEDDSITTVLEGDGFEAVHENNGVVSVCNREQDIAIICDEQGNVKSSFSSVSLSPGLFARTAFAWICGIYLALGAIVLCIRKLRRILAEGRTESIGPMLASVAVVLALGMAIGTLAHHTYQTSLATRANEIGMCAEYLESQAPELTDDMESCDDREAFRHDYDELLQLFDKLYNLIKHVVALEGAASNNNIGLYYVLYGKDDRGIFILMEDSDEHILGTSYLSSSDDDAVQKAFERYGAYPDTLHTGRTVSDTTQYRLVQIPASDGVGVAGVVEVGSKIRSFENSIISGLTRIVIAILVMMLVVFLTYSELRACGRCLFNYHERSKRQESDAIALLTRPLTFFVTLLASIDAVMTVLIARDLLEASGLDGSTALVAVPSIMLGLGLMIGQMLYGQLGSRLTMRRLTIGGSFAILVCAALTAIAVAFGGFWLYCICKLALSVPFGLLYTMGYSLPRVARSDKARATAAGGVKRTDTSAAALGTVLGGYAIQVMGDAWVYALVGVVCLPLILIAVNLLPRNTAPLETASSQRQVRKTTAIMLKSREARALALLVVLPATVAAGYASFLFPLFSSDLGLAKSDINNIVVLGQLVVYVSIAGIEMAEGRYGRWRVTASAIALLGLVFLLFSINTTIVWSVAVIALVGVLGKSSDGWKGMWLQTASELGAPAGSATGLMFATRSIALVAQPFILGALLGASDSMAAIVIGLLCAACALLLYLTTRRSFIARDAG